MTPRGPLEFNCPHCMALAGQPCVHTGGGTPFMHDGKPAQHLLRWIAADDAAKKEGEERTLTDWSAEHDREQAIDALF